MTTKRLEVLTDHGKQLIDIPIPAECKIRLDGVKLCVEEPVTVAAAELPQWLQELEAGDMFTGSSLGQEYVVTSVDGDQIKYHHPDIRERLTTYKSTLAGGDYYLLRKHARPLSETLQVGDVVNFSNDSSNTTFLGYDKCSNWVFRKSDGTLLAYDYRLPVDAATLVSRAADTPLHRRVRLGSKVKINRTNEIREVLNINGRSEHINFVDPHLYWTFTDFDAQCSLVEF